MWNVLHKTGIYCLWAYAFSVYWHELFYYPGPDWVDYLYYLGGVLAWAVRLAAWCKARSAQSSAGGFRAWAGGSVLVLSLLGLVGGAWWQGPAYGLMWDTQMASWLELYMPYWPFIPFLPLFLAVAAAWLLVRTH